MYCGKILLDLFSWFIPFNIFYNFLFYPNTQTGKEDICCLTSNLIFEEDYFVVVGLLAERQHNAKCYSLSTARSNLDPHMVRLCVTHEHLFSKYHVLSYPRVLPGFPEFGLVPNRPI